MIRNVKNQYHLIKTLLAGLYFGSPSKKLKIIGITGTDGKTTTTALLYHILKACGKKTSMVSTVYAKIGEREYETGLHTTTPDGIMIQKLIAESYKNGDEYFVLETTSHALDQNRNYGIACEVAILTNITHEHLDYHKTYEKYVKAKVKLFENATYSIINRDDQSYEPVKNLLSKSRTTIITYGLLEKSDFQTDLSKKTGLQLAQYNKYNFLAAYAAAKQLGLREKTVLDALKTFVFPKGRMETIYDKEYKVIIDFAHTPNAIEQALSAIKENKSEKGRIIHIFGSAAKRDVTKRPLMGSASARHADIIILTEEDYRDEDPTVICNQIAEGIDTHGFTFQQIPNDKKTYAIRIDRRDAIKLGLSIASKDDVVVITGKGHEQSLCRGTREIPWDDSKETLRIIKELSTTK